MAAPSKNWTNIADTQIDGSSPLDTILTTALRDDLVHLKEWLGYSYTAAQAHTHNGTDSALITALGGNVVGTASILDANVTLAKLKLATGSWTGNAATVVTVNRYAHNFATSVNGTTGSTVYVQYAGYSTGTTTGRQEQIYVNGTFSDQCSVYWDYHTN